MKKMNLFFGMSLLLILNITQPLYAKSAVDQALENYRGSENLNFSAERGEELWKQSNHSKKDGKTRECTTCHGSLLTKAGKHVKTGKTIDPMAPSVEPKRYAKLKKVEKWFKRNCKWTFGRLCTNQEKGDLLTYLSQL